MHSSYKALARTACKKKMEDSDVEMPASRFTLSGDRKKSEAEYEMLAVRNLSHRAFYQCFQL